MVGGKAVHRAWYPFARLAACKLQAYHRDRSFVSFYLSHRALIGSDGAFYPKTNQVIFFSLIFLISI